MIGRLLCKLLDLHVWLSDPPFRICESSRQVFVYRKCKHCGISDEHRIKW